MNSRNIFFVILTICFISTPLSYGQKNSKVKKAYEEFSAGHYSSAADMLRKAYSSVKNKDEQAAILFKIGECYRLTSEPSRAESWYIKAINKGYQDPIVHLYLADAKKMNQKYAEAKEEYVKYKEKAPNDRRADDGIKSTELAITWMETGNGYQVENMKFFNSRQSDYCPAYASDDYTTVYFTSSRDAATGKNVNAVTGESFSDIFVSKLDRKNVWSQPVPIDGDVNTEVDEGICSFTPDFRTMYFTRCRSAKNKAWGCQIVTAQLVNGRWTKEKAIDIANDSVVIAHPAISPDELTLYFVTDMPGGQGGKDIWKVTRSNSGDNWGTPENLGPTINTPGDEMFPYVHADGTLYFSSNGHIGLGGLDIFKARNDEGQWIVENLGYPINSPSDDFGITFQAESEQGFFSSNRTSRGDDDIFVFSLPPLAFNLTGVVVDEKTNAVLPESTVKIISSDGITNEMPTGADGTFKITLKPNVDYVFIASKKGYLNGKERETTKGLERSKDFRITIPLSSIANPIELTNIFYDFAKWDLRPESMVALDRLVETLNDNPHITIELGSHTDSRGTIADNEVLSQRRAQSVVDYLIQKDIASDRLTAKGYGEEHPKVVDDELAKQYPFLPKGTRLTEEFINSLTDNNQQEIAHQINRRTEFRVLRTDYNE
ncbi:MAG: OmpA family protein [Bacteroidales bacterium]|jgi:peptidoglycan-associated lipoprotein|nr:OmpA family protein [Bacteroidales bacterium]